MFDVDFELDLGFLDDGGDFDKWLSTLTIPRVLVMKNSTEDYDYFTAGNYGDLEKVLLNVFGRLNTLQLLVENHHYSKADCPYFRIYLDDYTESSVVNYKLQSFFALTGNGSLSSRCQTAVVVGASGYRPDATIVDVPFVFYMTTRDHLDDVGLYGPLQKLNLPAETMVRFPYQLLAPCARCSGMKTSCPRVLPCSKCKDGCEPSAVEVVIRARNVMTNVVQGLYYHNDLAKYQLHLQLHVMDKRSFLKKTESSDLRKRLRESSMCSTTDIHCGIVELLPRGIQSLMMEYPVHKVEWMDQGKYHAYCSNRYAASLMSADEIAATSSKHAICPKMVDYIGLAEPDMHYLMWCETLNTPGQPRMCKGAAYFKQEKRVSGVVVTMCTYVFSYEKLITFTAVSRSNTWVLGSR